MVTILNLFKQSGNTDDHIHAYRIDLTPLGKYKYKQGDLKGGDLKIGIGAAYVTWNNLSVNAGYEIQNDAVTILSKVNLMIFSIN